MKSDNQSRRDMENHSSKVFYLSTQNRKLIGQVCPMGHKVVGYKSKTTGIVGAYCLIERGRFPARSGEPGVILDRVKLAFRTHGEGAEGFWVSASEIEEAQP